MIIVSLKISKKLKMALVQAGGTGDQIRGITLA